MFAFLRVLSSVLLSWRFCLYKRRCLRIPRSFTFWWFHYIWLIPAACIGLGPHPLKELWSQCNVHFPWVKTAYVQVHTTHETTPITQWGCVYTEFWCILNVGIRKDLNEINDKFIVCTAHLEGPVSSFSSLTPWIIGKRVKEKYIKWVVVFELESSCTGYMIKKKKFDVTCQLKLFYMFHLLL